MLKMSTQKRYGALFLSTGLLLALSTGCVIDVTDIEPVGSYSDLTVTWSIDGQDAASLCTTYGIDHWNVEISGPELRTDTVNCHSNYWSTETNFYSILDGNYSIRVSAVDVYNATIKTISASAYLVDETKDVHLSFYNSDF